MKGQGYDPNMVKAYLENSCPDIVCCETEAVWSSIVASDSLASCHSSAIHLAEFLKILESSYFVTF